MNICKLAYVALCMIPLLYGGTWTETSQPDFSDGSFDVSLFASAYDGGSLRFSTSFDYNGDGIIDIVVSNEMSNYSDVFWGSPTGYTPANKTSYPGNSKGDWEAGDVNNDGYTELLSAQGDAYLIRIFKGTSNGPNPNDYTNVSLGDWNESCLLADLNRDGWLDLIVQKYNGYLGGIFWGGPSGYSSTRMTTLPATAGEHNIEAADFNKDGYLDLLFIREENNSKSYVFWNGPQGFNPANHATMANPPGLPSGSSIADVNRDGYLDVILTCFSGASVAYIYTGSANGFTLWKSLQVGSCFGGSSVADFNRDGYLDIVFTRGYGYDLQPVIYWGDPGGYSELKKSLIGPAVDASGALVADFNSDGILDIFVHNYGYPPEPSYFLYGPNFSTAVNPLPTGRDAHAIFREIGNVYTRNYKETYLSSIFDASAPVNWRVVGWTAGVPTGSTVDVSFRSGNKPVPDQTWTDWIPVANGQAIPELLNAQYLQYALLFSYINPANLPMLKDITVTYDPIEQLVAGLTIKPEVINLKSHGVFTGFITLPPEYNPGDIDLNTVQCSGARARSGEVTPYNLVAKFNVQDLIGMTPGSHVEFILTGKLKNGVDFYGRDTIRVIDVDYAMLACSPNPMISRAVLTIKPEAEGLFQIDDARVRIYSVNGALIRDFDEPVSDNGTGTLVWDRKDNLGRKVSAGIYLFKIEAGETSVNRKIIVID